MSCTDEERGSFADAVGNVLSREFETDLRKIGGCEDMIHAPMDSLFRRIFFLCERFGVFKHVAMARNKSEK